MRRLLFLLFFTTIMVNLLLVSCHTETTTGIDIQNPTAQLNFIYTETDTIVYYDIDSLAFYTIRGDSTSKDTVLFEDYSIILDSVRTYTFEVEAKDNQEIYRVSLMARDTETDLTYTIKSVLYPSVDKVEIEVDYLDFLGIPNLFENGVELYCRVNDETENTTVTSNLGFYVEGIDFLKFFYNTLGLFTEVDGAEIDFRDKIGKLNIIQFHSYG